MPDSRQPDRSRGIFETLLVVDGEPVEPGAHIDRLARSAEAVYGKRLPAEAEAELRRAAQGLHLGRLRLTVAPVEAGPRPPDPAGVEAGLRFDLLAGEVGPGVTFPIAGVQLRSHPLPGGLGAHKWADRRGINRPDPDQAGALILDAGEVLEAGWANIFAVRDGTLFTPPLDGRLLPGTTRAAVLQLAAEHGIASKEQSLRRDDLLAAEETFLTGSIRGTEPALSLDGRSLPGCGAVSRRLAVALRQRWGVPDERDVPRSSATAQKPDLLSR